MDYVIITLLFLPILLSFYAFAVAAKTKHVLLRVIGDTSLEKWLGMGRRIEDLEMRQSDMVERFNRFQQRESITHNRSKRASEKELIEEAKKIVEETTKPAIVENDPVEEKQALRRKVFGG